MFLIEVIVGIRNWVKKEFSYSEIILFSDESLFQTNVPIITKFIGTIQSGSAGFQFHSF